MYYRVIAFKRNRTSTRDKPRSGRSIEAATPEIIEKFQDMLLKD